LLKIRHTKDVVEAGEEIALGEKKIDWNIAMVVTVCFFHDIGRFKQILLGSFEDWTTNYDHGDEGAKIIEQRDWSDFYRLGIKREEVVEAVRRHNKYQVGTKNIYAKLVRDADKLALLRQIEFLTRKVDCKKGIVSKAVLSDYLAGRMVRNEKIVTKNDVYLRWLSWESDFNFETTKQLFAEEGVKNWVFSEIEKSDPRAFLRLRDVSLKE
jgi:HD superfamily phosphohydrolase YqeK